MNPTPGLLSAVQYIKHNPRHLKNINKHLCFSEHPSILNTFQQLISKYSILPLSPSCPLIFSNIIWPRSEDTTENRGPSHASHILKTGQGLIVQGYGVISFDIGSSYNRIGQNYAFSTKCRTFFHKQ